MRQGLRRGGAKLQKRAIVAEGVPDVASASWLSH